MQAILDHVIASAEQYEQQVSGGHSSQDSTSQQDQVKSNTHQTGNNIESNTHIRFTDEDVLVSSMDAECQNEAKNDLICDEPEHLPEITQSEEQAATSCLQDNKAEADCVSEALTQSTGDQENVESISVRHLFESIDNVLGHGSEGSPNPGNDILALEDEAGSKVSSSCDQNQEKTPLAHGSSSTDSD